MFSANQPSKLMIICDDDTLEYGNYLMQLISLKDDKGESVVGLRDGSVDAVLWSEKDFKDNQATLPASAYLLFIGDSKLCEEKAHHMNIVYNKYGMTFKSLGHQAVIAVDKHIPKKSDYEKFLELANNYNQKFKKVKLNFLKTTNTTIKAVRVLLPYVYPAAIYGLVSGHKAKKEILDQRYSFIIFYAYMELLRKFIEV